jgi:hypothetical protein
MSILQFHKRRIHLVFTILMGISLFACEREPRVGAYYGASTIEDRYGLTGAYNERITTDDGTVDATVVPITLSDGRTAQVVIPRNQLGGHRVFLRDANGLSPIVLENSRVSRAEFVRTPPRVVERSADTSSSRSVTPKRKRSWQKEALIIGGSTGAGAAIGAVAGGGKGAAVGAVSGGIAGLIYDLATRNKK